MRDHNDGYVFKLCRYQGLSETVDAIMRTVWLPMSSTQDLWQCALNPARGGAGHDIVLHHGGRIVDSVILSEEVDGKLEEEKTNIAFLTLVRYFDSNSMYFRSSTPILKVCM